MNKIPVGKTIGYAYAFTFGNLGTVIGLTWLAMLLTVALNYAGLEAMRPAILDETLAQTNPAVALRMVGWFFLSMLVAMFFQAMVAVAVVRQALGLRTGGAAVHLAAGGAEWRMFGAHLRFLFATIGVVILFYLGVLVVALVGGFLARVTPLFGFVVLAVVVVLAGAAIYTVVRMGFLLSPSNLAERGGGIRRSYELTKGNFWRIVGIWLATGLPLLAAFFAAQYVLYWHVFDMDITGLPNSADAAKEFMERYNRALHAVNVEMMNQQIPIQIATFVYGILNAGLTYGAAAFAYRALVPAAPVAAAGTPSGDLRTT